MDAKAFTDVLNPSSAPSTHNGYIYTTDAAATDWNLRPDGEAVRYIKLASSATSTETVNGSSVTTDGHILSIDRSGLTLYDDNVATDIGLAVREDAKVTVIQTIRGDRTVRTYTGLKEAWDYLVDRDSTSETTKNFAGSITAILDSAGRATWLVFDSKGGTGINQNDDPVVSNVPAVKVPASATAAQIKTALSAQPYGVYSVTGLTGKDPGAPRASSQENIRYFTFNTKNDGDQASLIITDKDNQVCYSEAEAAIATKGFHYYYVDIGAGPRTGGVAGTIAANSAFPRGTYTYTIRIAGQDEVFTGTFEVG